MTFWQTPEGQQFWKRLKPAARRLLNAPKGSGEFHEAYRAYSAIEREIAEKRTIR